MGLSKHWNLVKEKYKLLKLIGAGTNGEVVLAKLRDTQTEIAIKMIVIDE